MLSEKRRPLSLGLNVLMTPHFRTNPNQCGLVHSGGHVNGLLNYVPIAASHWLFSMADLAEWQITINDRVQRKEMYNKDLCCCKSCICNE